MMGSPHLFHTTLGSLYYISYYCTNDTKINKVFVKMVKTNSSIFIQYFIIQQLWLGITFYHVVKIKEVFITSVTIIN